MSLTKNHQIYKGPDIHAYTSQVREMVDIYMPEVYEKYGDKLSREELENLLLEFEKKFGPKVTYSNIRNNFHNGRIFDKDVPKLNCAILLKVIWEILNEKNDASLYKHFDETLNQICSTCIQGISFRLFLDYVALYIV